MQPKNIFYVYYTAYSKFTNKEGNNNLITVYFSWPNVTVD